MTTEEGNTTIGIGDQTAADIGAISMYDISIYGGDKTKLTRKERMRRRARRMIKAGLREDQCYCCSLEGVPVTACLIIGSVIIFVICCVFLVTFMLAGFSITQTFTEPGD
uniref:Uncharacterized protein n=1 Tax=Ascaris lumbricoides TaxID=6252 RepID=A0A0M3IPM1_ASCLU